MKKLLFSSLTIFFICLSMLSQSQVLNNYQFYDVLPGTGNAIRFWSSPTLVSNTYKIMMGSETEYRLGAVNSYSIKMTMNADATRGWTWGVAGSVPIASLSTLGKFQISNKFIYDATTSRMGIGTITPNATLALENAIESVSISLKSGAGDSFWISSGSSILNIGSFGATNGSGVLRINNTRNVGIGKDPTDVQLDINGTTRFTGSSTGTNWTEYTGIQLYATASQMTSSATNSLDFAFANAYNNPTPKTTSRIKAVSVGTYAASGSDLLLETASNNTDTWNTNQLCLKNNGNVGIGVSSPGYKLDVNGVIRATGFVNAAGQSILSQWTTVTGGISYTAGKIGVGTTTPTKGKINIIGDGIDNGIAIAINNTTANVFRMFNVGSDSYITNHYVQEGLSGFSGIKMTQNAAIELITTGVYIKGAGSPNGAGLNIAATIGSAIEANAVNTLSIYGNPIKTYSGKFYGGHFVIARDNATETNPDFFVNYDGNITMGTATPYGGSTPYKLSVKGKIACQELKVDIATASWPDYVFSDTYKLRSIKELESFIKENKHLPEIETAQEIEQNGVSVGEMQTKMMQKIEELTLYIIQQQKMMEKQQATIETLQEEVATLKK